MQQRGCMISLTVEGRQDQQSCLPSWLELRLCISVLQRQHLQNVHHPIAIRSFLQTFSFLSLFDYHWNTPDFESDFGRMFVKAMRTRCMMTCCYGNTRGPYHREIHILRTSLTWEVILWLRGELVAMVECMLYTVQRFNIKQNACIYTVSVVGFRLYPPEWMVRFVLQT